MEKVIYKAHEIRPVKTTVHRVRILDGQVEVALTDSKGHYWFEKYDEKQLKDFFNNK
jgi:hypothetical protein